MAIAKASSRDRSACRGRLTTRLVAALFAATLAACGKPGVTGSVLPEPAERAGLPWKDVEVRLLRGNLMEELRRLATACRNDTLDEARQRVLESAKTEHDAGAEALRRARATLGIADPEAASPSESSSIHTCLASAEAELGEAKHRYRGLLNQSASRLAAVGVATDSPARALEQLRAVVRAKTESESRRLRDEYLSSQLDQQSNVVLAGGLATDRLCWTVQNKRDLAVQFRGPVVVYNGRPLPESVATRIWGLPAPNQPLRIPNPDSADNDVLLPGASFEACFYGLNARLPLDVVQTYGFSIDNPTRSGEWRVQWQDIQFVSTAGTDDHTGAHHPPKVISVESVFDDRIRQFQSELEEGRLIELLSRSDAARALTQAEGKLLACHAAIDREKGYQDTERVIQAIAAKQNGEFSVDVRMRPILKQLVREPSRLSKWVDEAVATVDRITVARQTHPFGEAFHFSDVAPGRYTLLAKSVNEKAKPKLWLIPIDVDGSINQDLVGATARDKTLRATIEAVLQASS